MEHDGYLQNLNSFMFIDCYCIISSEHTFLPERQAEYSACIRRHSESGRGTVVLTTS